MKELLKVENLSKSDILKDIGLLVYKGEMIAIRWSFFIKYLFDGIPLGGIYFSHSDTP